MDRLNFFAAAEHARAVGTRNSCGLFATIVRRGLWQYITLADEDAARAKLQSLIENGWPHERVDTPVAVEKNVLQPQGTQSATDRLCGEVSDTERAQIRSAILESLGLPTASITYMWPTKTRIETHRRAA